MYPPDGSSTVVAAAIAVSLLFIVVVGVIGLWLTSRQQRRTIEIGRWYCCRCRVVWRGATTHGRAPKHGCGQWMIPTTSAADELD